MQEVEMQTQHAKTEKRQLTQAEADEFILQIRPFCQRLASRKCMRDMREDIEQELMYEAIKLLRTYDPDAGVRFLTYAFVKLSSHAVMYHKRNRYPVTAPRAVTSGIESMAPIVPILSERDLQDADDAGILVEKMIAGIDAKAQYHAFLCAVSERTWTTQERQLLHVLLSGEEPNRYVYSRIGLGRKGPALLVSVREKLQKILEDVSHE